MDKTKLIEIIDSDEFGLLVVNDKPKAISSDDRLIEAFEEINTFFDQRQQMPTPNSTNIREYTLYKRLEGLLKDENKIQLLKKYDRHKLLETLKAPRSINDIVDDDLLKLTQLEENIYKLNNVPKVTTMPDYIAKRIVCKDFGRFEYKFIQCHEDLKSGKRILKPFANEQQIQEGYFFILKGIMVYVESVGERTRTNGKVNARLRCIFENGTESDMLLRSLASELYKDGRRITEHNDKLLANFEGVDKDDIESGFIYVLKSLSSNPEITARENLYKIGYSTKPVTDRVKNATADPTFFKAPVEIIDTYQCFNLNPQKFEKLLHKFFWKVRLDTEVAAENGISHAANEWFIVPLNVIQQAIKLIINGEIIYYYYDDELEEIMLGEQWALDIKE